MSVGLKREEPNVGPDHPEANDCSGGAVVSERKRDKFRVGLLRQRCREAGYGLGLVRLRAAGSSGEKPPLSKRWFAFCDLQVSCGKPVLLLLLCLAFKMIHPRCARTQVRVAPVPRGQHRAVPPVPVGAGEGRGTPCRSPCPGDCQLGGQNCPCPILVTLTGFLLHMVPHVGFWRPGSPRAAEVPAWRWEDSCGLGLGQGFTRSQKVQSSRYCVRKHT